MIICINLNYSINNRSKSGGTSGSLNLGSVSKFGHVLGAEKAFLLAPSLSANGPPEHWAVPCNVPNLRNNLTRENIMRISNWKVTRDQIRMFQPFKLLRSSLTRKWAFPSGNERYSSVSPGPFLSVFFLNIAVVGKN